MYETCPRRVVVVCKESQHPELEQVLALRQMFQRSRTVRETAESKWHSGGDCPVQ
jgi:hypothetical protein